jgi:hypothetical protein
VSGVTRGPLVGRRLHDAADWTLSRVHVVQPVVRADRLGVRGRPCANPRTRPGYARRARLACHLASKGAAGTSSHKGHCKECCRDDRLRMPHPCSSQSWVTFPSTEAYRSHVVLVIPRSDDSCPWAPLATSERGRAQGLEPIGRLGLLTLIVRSKYVSAAAKWGDMAARPLANFPRVCRGRSAVASN